MMRCSTAGRKTLTFNQGKLLSAFRELVRRQMGKNRETRIMRRGRSSVVLRFCCAMFLAAPFAFGQAKKPAGKTYVLKAARMFDGKSDALLKPGLVVVTDGKIAGVGPSAAIPAGAEVIDFGDATLLPGFIDAHTHLTAMYSEDYKRSELDQLQ